MKLRDICHFTLCWPYGYQKDLSQMVINIILEGKTCKIYFLLQVELMHAHAHARG